MTRRLWLLTVASGLGFGLLPGCLHAPRDGADPPPFAPPAKDAGGADGKPAPPAETAAGHQAALVDARPPVRPAPIERARLEVTPVEQPPPRPPGPGVPEPPLPLPPSLAPVAPPDPPVVAALRCLADKHPAEALTLLQRYDRTRQEVLLTLLPLAARVAEVDFDRASPQEKAALLDQLAALSQCLRSQAPLVLEHLCFCQEIAGFADYRPLPPDHAFQAGADGRPGELVRVYVEVRNFNSRPCGAYYETSQTYTLEVLDFHKRVVWKKSFPPRVDRSRSPREDYFINFQFWVPANMPQGEYTLRVRVQDDTRPLGGGPAPRVAEGSLDFQVRGGGAARPAPEAGR